MGRWYWVQDAIHGCTSYNELFQPIDMAKMYQMGSLEGIVMRKINSLKMTKKILLPGESVDGLMVRRAVVSHAQPESKGDRPSIAAIVGSMGRGRNWV